MNYGNEGKLDANENVLGTSPKALEAIRSVVDISHSYPDPLHLELKKMIADVHSIAPSQVSVASGSSACLDYIVQGLTKKGETILAFERSFIAYKELARVHQRIYQEIAMLDHQYSFERLINSIDDDVKLIFLDIPNNPTGQILKHDELEAVLKKVNPLSFVVVDEAYAEYADDKDYPNMQELFLKYPNLIIVRTFSKIHGLAGLRCGYTLAKESVLRKIKLYKPPFTVNHFAVAAAKAALNDTEFLDKSIAINKEGRDYLFNELSKLGYNLFPTQGNFIYMYFNDDQEKEEIINRLSEESIKVCNLSIFNLDRSLRITVGMHEANSKIVSVLSNQKATV